ncbi:helix-turn-helix DNA-binding domain protein [Mycobacterium phage DarthPhader]|uniref:Helix-turn-helix DNA-binding domain protein n=1 Tax=Mycobacterium phage DarthPhader TaxID=1912975 RepID=A0A1I9S3Y1_9CAUD|nr:transcriptional repressor [Mycobacterium phage DarthPhader]AOZ61275.1 helix-turn-helix DNA-binding domain protein [Mycobacterium phage DarthPhader]
MSDVDRPLRVTVGYLVGRQVTLGQMLTALGMSRSTYYAQMEAGTLHSADHLVKTARHFHLNPVDLLVRYEIVTLDECLEVGKG